MNKAERDMVEYLNSLSVKALNSLRNKNLRAFTEKLVSFGNNLVPSKILDILPFSKIILYTC